jgi:hypothetical protein
MDSDPDPAIFVIGLQDTNKKLIFVQRFSAHYFLKVPIHLHHFSKIKSPKEVIKHKIFLPDDRRIRMRIRIHTSDLRILQIPEAQNMWIRWKHCK